MTIALPIPALAAIILMALWIGGCFGAMVESRSRDPRRGGKR